MVVVGELDEGTEASITSPKCTTSDAAFFNVEADGREWLTTDSLFEKR